MNANDLRVVFNKAKAAILKGPCKKRSVSFVVIGERITLTKELQYLDVALDHKSFGRM